jgi:uncharacterized protein
VITDPAFYAVAAFAIILNGISKSGFAGAFAGIAVPLMSIFIVPQQAAAIMLPVLLAMDVFGLAAFYKHIDRKVLLTLLPGGVAGTLLGAFTFGAFDANVVRVVIGVIAVTFPLMMWLKIGANRPAAQPNHRNGFVAATAAGYTSFVAHAGAPPALIYLMPLRLEKQHLIATNAVFFAFLNFIKIPPYFALGQLNFANLSTALVLCLVTPIGIRIGLWLQGRVSTETVYRVGRIGLFLTGCKLIYDGVAALVR